MAKLIHTCIEKCRRMGIKKEDVYIDGGGGLNLSETILPPFQPNLPFSRISSTTEEKQK